MALNFSGPLSVVWPTRMSAHMTLDSEIKGIFRKMSLVNSSRFFNDNRQDNRNKAKEKRFPTFDPLLIDDLYVKQFICQAAKNGDLEGLTSVYTTCELNDRERDMVMYVACRHGQLEIVQWLVRVLKMSVQESMDGFTPLGLACRAGHLGTVQYLIEDCECIVGDVEVKSGVSTVMFGMRGNAEVRAYLMGRGIDVPPELLEEEAVAAEKKRLKEEKKKHNKDLKLKQLAKKRKAEQAALAARNSGIVAPAAPGDIMMCGPDGVKRRRSNSTLPPTPMRVTRRASMKASGSPDIKPAQAP